MSDSNRKRAKGFSLIELLVSIAVIALLMVIIVPVIGSVRERADSSRCVSNIRQCSTLLLQLASDNNNEIEVFRAGTAGSAGASSSFWANQISQLLRPSGSRHTKVLDVIYCPSFKPFRYSDTNSTWAWDCYAMDMRPLPGVSVVEKDGYSLHLLQLHAVENPASHLLLVDSMIVASSGPKQRFNIRTEAPNNANGGVHLRHNHHANASFLDGHIEALDLKRLKDLGFTAAYSQDGRVVRTER